MCTANRLGILCILAVLTLIGCARGLLYTNITTPYTTDFRSKDSTGTPVGVKKCTIDDYTIRYYVSFEWTDNEILPEARVADLKKIYYIDLETLSVLGVFQLKSYIIYGE